MREGRHDKPLASLLVKPAGPDCNLACGYCFYLDRSRLFPGSRTHRMSEEVLRRTVQQAMNGGAAEVTFCWQGGEPTLLGLDFYRKAVAFQVQYGRNQRVGNGFQTNGILIDNDWARFFRQYDFLIGLSLDGPKPIHDKYRRHPDGRGTWDKVVGRVKLLLDAGVAVNALSVVNEDSVRYPDEIYEFHKSLGLTYMQFIPCVEADPLHPARPSAWSVPAEAYGRFLTRLFDLWLADFQDGRPTTSVRFFDSVLASYLGQEPPDCTLKERCGEYLVVEHNGDVFSCDFFVEPSWRLGNVLEGNLRDMLNSERQEAFGSQKADLSSTCAPCPWLPLCRGGCPKDRQRLRDGGNKDPLCAAHKKFFGHADKAFRRLTEE